MNIEHPYTDLNGCSPLRGNLHTHTTRSDGLNPPQAVIDDYAGRGYDFLMISDHDVYTTEAELSQWNSRGMVLLPGNEVSAGGPHLLHVGAGGFIAPDPLRQTVISAIVAGGGLAVVNHPNWQDKFDHCTAAQLREWVGYTGMEIYNGVIGRLQGDPYALMKWDAVLSSGRRVWGLANDDSHQPQKDVGLGWNMVYAKERTPRAVIEALRTGRFYASTGVTIRRIAVEGDQITVQTDNAERVVASMQFGQRIACADGPSLTVTPPATAKYVRLTCWGRGESFAWTQPFFIQNDTSATAKERFLDHWQVSELVPGLESSSAPYVSATDKAGKLTWTEQQTGGLKIPDGMLDIRAQAGGRDGVVYCWTKVKSPSAGMGQLGLGYDGPVRVWLNGEQVFDGPGTNPAHPDKAVFNVKLKGGDNELLVALGTNAGRAWGIFARCVPPARPA